MKKKASKKKLPKTLTRAQDLNVPASELPVFEHEADFRNSFHWRVLRIMAEFVDGWNFLADVKKSVTIFGSARFPKKNRWYQEARKLGRLLADKGYSVITGGGPGIMEAANMGASEGGGPGDSFGLNIKLPFEQRANPFVEKGVSFHYFFVRKVMLAYSAQAYVYMPGGWGTFDELTEIITLIQTKKISAKIPIILVGKEFWSPFLKWVDEMVQERYQAVSASDKKLYRLVDTAEEALKIIEQSPRRTEFG
ncbi:MAG: TIGR00730 family Rossman fold protein [Patescibacteria group bacterium]|jgi:hypothetical protein